MKINLSHSTTYCYETPVYLQAHILRLRPRTNGAQQLLDFDLEVTPTPAGMTECLDQDGNLATNASFAAPTSELIVRSRCSVKMLRENPFDYVLTEASLSLPLRYLEPLNSALTPYRIDMHIAQSVK